MPSGKCHEGSFSLISRTDGNGNEWHREITDDGWKVIHVVADNSVLKPTNSIEKFVYRETGEIFRDEVHYYKIIKVKILRPIQTDPILYSRENRSRQNATGFQSLSTRP